MENTNKLTIEQKQILKSLAQSDENIVLKAVKDMRDKGGEYVIEPVMDVYFNHKSEKIQAEVLRLFQDLKDSKLNNLITDNIVSYSSNERLSDFISALWQSSVKFDNTLVFLEIFVKENEATSLEALTLIQQNADVISDDMRAMCLKTLKAELLNLSEFKKNLAIDLLEIFE